MKILRTSATATLVLTVALLTATITPAAASVAVTSTATSEVRGTVYALASTAKRVFAAGEFNQVGIQSRTNLVSLYMNGSVDTSFDLPVNGVVKALAVSPDQTKLFVGGTFTEVAGTPRVNLAAIDIATRTVIPSWRADTNGAVLTLATRGGRLYAGGRFTTLGPRSIKRLGAIDIATGNVLAWNPWPTYTVTSLAVTPDGARLYAGGSFTEVRGQARPGIVEVDTATGLPTSWVPDAGGVIVTVAVAPSGRRFYATTQSNRTYQYEPATATAPRWTMQTGGDVQAILDMGTEMYFGGHFGQITDGGIKRFHIASMDPETATITGWDPGCGGSLGVWDLEATPAALVVGGDFYKCGGRWQQGVAFFAGTP